LNPVFREVQEVKKSNLETFLDQNAPDWRVYEDSMMGNLRKHPTLVSDPLNLYRMSVPSDVLESRATQKALKKMQDKTKATGTSATSTTKTKTGEMPDKPMTFDEAVEFAKKEVASQGLAP
jgi:hypothetical protein